MHGQCPLEFLGTLVDGRGLLYRHSYEQVQKSSKDVLGGMKVCFVSLQGWRKNSSGVKKTLLDLSAAHLYDGARALTEI